MKFETARRLTMVLTVLAFAAIILGYALYPEGNSMRDTMIITGGGIVAAAILIIVAFCRCPYCGKILISGLFVLKVCPKCSRHLATGEKMKGKRARRQARR